MRFAWDEAKTAANIAKHGVSFPEGATVFGDPPAITYPDPDHSVGEERHITFGRSARGRLLVVAHVEQQDACAWSARGRRRGGSGESMKKARASAVSDLRPEYSRADLAQGVRGRYVKQYRTGANLALLAPDVAAAFPTDNAVNDALRALLRAAKAVKVAAPRARRTRRKQAAA